MVDLQALSTKVGAMLANSVLGTSVEVKIIAGRGITSVGPNSAQKGDANVTLLPLGNATNNTDVTLELAASPLAQPETAELRNKASTGDDVAEAPVQVQLRYTR